MEVTPTSEIKPSIESLSTEIEELKTALKTAETRAGQAEERAARAEELSLTDTLTELPNRRHINKELERQLAEVNRGQHALAVVFLDVDHFKQVNDEFGHEQGDKVLKDLGKSLSSSIRTTDILGRYAGDEFVITLSFKPEDQHNLPQILQRYIDHAHTINRSNKEDEFIPQTISIGCALIFPNSNISSETALKAADAAVYRSKAKGRNCFTISILNEQNQTFLGNISPKEQS